MTGEEGAVSMKAVVLHFSKPGDFVLDVYARTLSTEKSCQLENKH